jgi:transcriptional regulator with XRE-family HTH domain
MIKPSNEFSKRLRDTREKRGLSATDLARLTGVTPAAVSNWENKGTEPQSKALNAIAATLGVTKEWLMTGVGDGNTPAPTLENFSLEELLHEIARRGFTVTVAPKPA